MGTNQINQTEPLDGTVYLEGHRLMKGWRIGGGARTQHVSACECGWSSALCLTQLRAEWMHREHCGEHADRAATVIEQDAVEEPDREWVDDGLE